ncbi:hypothetical protein V2P20_02275 [Methylobacter sp. Wu1]|uniref:hypothetical protein n=1 Tax=Methylobacter sp. Wu1 TaxID=3119359 RepID=UPI002F95A728
MQIYFHALVPGEPNCLTLRQIRIMVDDIHEPDQPFSAMRATHRKALPSAAKSGWSACENL